MLAKSRLPPPRWRRKARPGPAKDRELAEKVLAAVEDEYSLPRGTVKSKERQSMTVDEAKGLAAYLIRLNTSLGWRNIGHEMGGRSWMTVKNLVITTIGRLGADDLARVHGEAVARELDIKLWEDPCADD
jgi:hypothetical protein